ncbi:GumC family protein [Thermocoleostomius sinensis]|jgi:capsular exopolysaccharide synthesis family protein|uniref:non-specific protein-tyrosine kinase n=1 Tax=Thermocoleostomius sinensis A174 TaxID=2016057 RepID=A0A9E8ZHD6_9CYAN|nr:tyrosine-protein kinase domain-containing protein [Thermocoleostomius sinensis]WAL58556.1 polysaccharide biosynthesis tyrosine autokinase [Thermocoleostomius sinensis A174]
METEQTSQALTSSVRNRSLIQPSVVDSDEVDNQSNRGLNLRSLGRTVQRQALLIAGVATLVAVGASYLAMQEAPVYEGDFRILAEPVTNVARAVDPFLVSRGRDDLPGRDAFSLDYTTQIQILLSPGMLNDIVQEVQTQYPNFSFEDLQRGLEVQRLAVEGSTDPTRIIQVTYAGEDPGLVQKVLRVTADRYLQYSLEDRKTRTGEGIKFLEDQLPALEQRVSQIQDEIQQLQQQNDLIDPDLQGDQLSTQLNDITTLALATDRELQEQQQLYSNLQQQVRLNPEQAVAASALSEDPNYQALQTQLVELQGQIAVESARFGSNSPVLRSLEARRANIEALLASRAEAVVGPGNTGNPQVQAFQNSVRLDLIGQLITARNQIQVLEVRKREIEQARRQYQQQFQRFPEVARRYSDLTRELEISVETLDRLRTQLETLRVDAAQTEVPWELISEPLIPRDSQGDPIPEPSKASRIVIAGAALGLILGALLALLLERYRNVFYTVDDIYESIPLPLAGVIPFSRGAKQSFDFPSAFSAEDIDDSRLGTASFREAFTDLYSNIRLAEPPVRSLMICSAEPGDGKTTIALYLAQTAAGAGQKVLLVDTNLRLPQVHHRLDLPNTRGLSGLLSADHKLEGFIQQSSLADTLYVLTAGPSIPGSARLLGSDRMKQLMEKFENEYDLVIYDTPHLYGLTDASFLTTQVDEILMVVATNKTNRTVVDQVLNKLTTVRPTGVSVVANYLKENNASGPYTRYNPPGGRPRRDVQIERV